MKDSILIDTKKMLGLEEAYTPFDHDVMTHINAVFSTLSQLGLGPSDGYLIMDAGAQWTDFMPMSETLSLVKTYVFLKVRSYFDPPQTGFLLEALNKQIAECEWRLNIFREPPPGWDKDMYPDRVHCDETPTVTIPRLPMLFVSFDVPLDPIENDTWLNPITGKINMWSGFTWTDVIDIPIPPPGGSLDYVLGWDYNLNRWTEVESATLNPGFAGDTLIWDNDLGRWVPQQFELKGLLDVDFEGNTPQKGDILTWDSKSNKWVLSQPQVNQLSSINALGDVDTDSVPVGSGKVLSWDDSIKQWVPKDAAGLNPGFEGTVLMWDDVVKQWVPIVASIDSLVDVDTTTTPPDQGYALTWDGQNWVPNLISEFFPVSIDQFPDVDTTTNAPADGDTLVWKAASSAWVPTGISGSVPITIDAFEDVDTSTTLPLDTQVLTWDGGANIWIPMDLPPALSLTSLDLFDDVDLATNPPTNAQVLRYNEALSLWFPEDLPSFDPSSIDIFDDVDTTSNPPVDAQVLTWDGGANIWIPLDLPPAFDPSTIDLFNDVDLSTTAPTDGQVLQYNESLNLWFPEDLTSFDSSSINIFDDVDTNSNAPVDSQVLTWDGGANRWIPENIPSNKGPIEGVIVKTQTGTDQLTWNQLAASLIVDPGSPDMGMGWSVGSASIGDGQIYYDANSDLLVISKYDNTGVLGDNPAADMISGTVIRVAHQSNSNIFTEFRLGGRVAYADSIRYDVERVLGHGSAGAINWSSVGTPVKMTYDVSPTSVFNILTPNTYWWVLDPIDPIPPGVPNVGGDSAKMGDLIGVLDSNGDGIADTLRLYSSSEENLAHQVLISRITGESPTGSGTTTSHGTPVAWNHTEMADIIASGAHWVIDVRVPTTAQEGYLSLVEIVNGGSTVHWIETIPATLARNFSTHIIHASEVVRTNSFLKSDELAVQFTTNPGTVGTLSLVDSDGFVGRISHSVSAQAASNITAATSAPDIAGEAADEYWNLIDGRGWIHDGTHWIELPIRGLPSTTGRVAGDLLEIVNPSTGTYGWKTYKLPEITKSVSRVLTNGYTETFDLVSHNGDLHITGASIGQSILIYCAGGNESGEIKGLYRDDANASLATWNASIPNTSPQQLLLIREDSNTVMHLDLDMHRLPDGRHIGKIALISSGHRMLWATLFTPPSVTTLSLCSYGGEVGNVEIEAVTYK